MTTNNLTATPANPRIELAAKDEALLGRINADARELGTLRVNLIPSKPVGTLACLILTPHIREYLEQNDPMALKQARVALMLEPTPQPWKGTTPKPHPPELATIAACEHCGRTDLPRAEDRWGNWLCERCTKTEPAAEWAE